MHLQLEGLFQNSFLKSLIRGWPNLFFKKKISILTAGRKNGINQSLGEWTADNDFWSFDAVNFSFVSVNFFSIDHYTIFFSEGQLFDAICQILVDDIYLQRLKKMSPARREPVTLQLREWRLNHLGHWTLWYHKEILSHNDLCGRKFADIM